MEKKKISKNLFIGGILYSTIVIEKENFRWSVESKIVALFNDINTELKSLVAGWLL